MPGAAQSADVDAARARAELIDRVLDRELPRYADAIERLGG